MQGNQHLLECTCAINTPPDEPVSRILWERMHRSFTPVTALCTCSMLQLLNRTCTSKMRLHIWTAAAALLSKSCCAYRKAEVAAMQRVKESTRVCLPPLSDLATCFRKACSTNHSSFPQYRECGKEIQYCSITSSCMDLQYCTSAQLSKES